MIKRKYKLTNEVVHFEGKILHRIKALRNFGKVEKDDLGGFIESEYNLSHEGDCWIDDNSIVLNSAKICDNAKIINSTIKNEVLIGEYACICDSKIEDSAKIYGDAKISDSKIYQNAKVYKSAIIMRSDIFGDATIKGYIDYYSKICGSTHISETAKIPQNSRIFSDKDYFVIGPIGSRNDNVTFAKLNDGSISVFCGCFVGDIDWFESRVRQVHFGTIYEKEYLAAINLAKIHMTENEGEE